MTANTPSRRGLVSFTPRTETLSADLIHIASLLVQTTAQGMPLARHAAATLPGAVLHDTAAPGKFVVVLESAHDRAIADAADFLLQVAGVLTVSIVAHLMAPAAELEQDV